MALAVLESTASIYARTWASVETSIRNREFQNVADNIVARLFVNPATGVSATGRSSAEVTAYWNALNP